MHYQISVFPKSHYNCIKELEFAVEMLHLSVCQYIIDGGIAKVDIT